MQLSAKLMVRVGAEVMSLNLYGDVLRNMLCDQCVREEALLMLPKLDSVKYNSRNVIVSCEVSRE